MGYYTKYELTVVTKKDYVKERDILQPCESCGGTGTKTWDILEVLAADEDSGVACVLAGESTKWYDHEKEMREISENYPTIVFRLAGEGEEAGDVWVKYFKGGKMQHHQAEMKLDEFDERKLQ